MSTTVLASDLNGLTVTNHSVELSGDHDPERHAALVADPRRFCGVVSVVTDLAVGSGSVAVTTAAVPYCRSRQFRANPPGEAPTPTRPFTIGFNITVSAGPGDGQLILARRSEELAHGGGWHVTANEDADPGDLAEGPVDIEAAASRALAEEAGLEITAEELVAVTTCHQLFSVDGQGALGLAIHVRLGALGYDADEVQRARSRAPDAWEASELAVVEATQAELGRLAGQWSPWAQTCWDGALDVLSAPASQAA